MKIVAGVLLTALAACGGIAPRDCSVQARLAAHAGERAQFRTALGAAVSYTHCPPTNPEVLIPEENRVSSYKQDLVARIRASELRADLEQAEREALRASEGISVDCLGVRWTGEEHVRAGRAGRAREMEQLRALDTRFQALSRRIAEC